jgi:hypothetical protein
MAVNFVFLDRSRYFIEIAPQLSSRGRVDPIPDPLLLRKSGCAGNWTQDLWNCRQELWPLDQRGGRFYAHHDHKSLNTHLGEKRSSDKGCKTIGNTVYAKHVLFTLCICNAPCWCACKELFRNNVECSCCFIWKVRTASWCTMYPWETFCVSGIIVCSCNHLSETEHFLLFIFYTGTFLIIKILILFKMNIKRDLSTSSSQCFSLSK